MSKAQTDADKAAADYWRSTARGEQGQAEAASSMARTAEAKVGQDEAADARQAQRRRTIARR
jgi:hypothetical protein